MHLPAVVCLLLCDITQTCSGSTQAAFTQWGSSGWYKGSGKEVRVKETNVVFGKKRKEVILADSTETDTFSHLKTYMNSKTLS